MHDHEMKSRNVWKVTRFIRLAHDECYIANSLRTEIVVEPTLRRG